MYCIGENIQNTWTDLITYSIWRCYTMDWRASDPSYDYPCVCVWRCWWSHSGEFIHGGTTSANCLMVMVMTFKDCVPTTITPTGGRESRGGLGDSVLGHSRSSIWMWFYYGNKSWGILGTQIWSGTLHVYSAVGCVQHAVLIVFKACTVCLLNIFRPHKPPILNCCLYYCTLGILTLTSHQLHAGHTWARRTAIQEYVQLLLNCVPACPQRSFGLLEWCSLTRAPNAIN